MIRKSYLKDVWQARYFWSHLANAELRYKFRRSKLGLLWTMVTPLGLTIMMTFILGNLLKVPMQDYAPYVYSGLVVWDFLITAVVSGCQSLLVSEPYIRQYKHPIIIYPLKSTLVNLATLLIALTGLILWILVTKPLNLLISLAALPLSILLMFMIGWPLTILTSFTHLKYRDFAQVMVLVMQFIWYTSPVFFEAKMFTSINMAYLVEYNPISHMLNLFRAPLLYGRFPALADYGFVLGTAVVLYLLAFLKVRSDEKSLIFFF